MARPDNTALLQRIEHVLQRIHQNLSHPWSVAELAKLSGWSRWQFQRVFSAHTGLSVAQYVRELRLSRAAEALLNTRDRHLDIALACGFDSEISFSRSFKQLFGCTPGAYRRRGLRMGLRAPILVEALPEPPMGLHPRLPQIRIEARPAFEVVGLSTDINGLFSPEPDFAIEVPQLWERLRHTVGSLPRGPRIGVLDTTHALDNGLRFPYWASLETAHLPQHQALSRLRVPEQHYAVLPFQGPLRNLEKALEWFLQYWLPAAGLRGIHGYDLELYPADFDAGSEGARMEYWVPVAPQSMRPLCLPRHTDTVAS